MQKNGQRRAVRFASAAALLAALAGAACAPKAGRLRTDVMEKAPAVSSSITAAVLRARVDDLAERLAGRVEETADVIRAETRDPVVRRRALRAKIEGIPAIYSAAYRADPLEALVDVWALAFQMTHFLEEGEGREFFGAQQPLGRALARDVLADADAVAQGVTVGPEAYAKARATVEDWARRNPVERHFTSRPSMASQLAELRSERNAFVAVGAVSDTLDSLSHRLNTYAAQLPKQARWQAELLVADLEHEPVVSGALGDVRALGTTARAANELLDPGFLGAEDSLVRRMLAAERRAVLDGVDVQRAATLDYVTAERMALLAAVREERLALVAAVRQERLETLAEVEAIRSRTVDSAIAGLRELIDYALPRVAGLLLLLMPPPPWPRWWGTG